MGLNLIRNNGPSGITLPHKVLALRTGPSGTTWLRHRHPGLVTVTGVTELPQKVEGLPQKMAATYLPDRKVASYLLEIAMAKSLPQVS